MELEAEVKTMDFFLCISRKFSEQIRLDKIVFKERRFRQTVWGKLKSRDFIYCPMLITVISLFPLYLEWTKASLRTILLQNTGEQLLQEVAAT